MIATFTARFLKDIAKLPDAAAKTAVANLIEAAETAETMVELPSLKKLKGFKNAYRIRLGDYRIGVFITGTRVEFARVVHRRDIYQLFP